MKSLNVLYSFPHRLGRSRICTTAWYEIASLARAGAHVRVLTADSVRPFAQPISVSKTLTRGPFTIPYRLFGIRRACRWHDWIVARHIARSREPIDIVHAWPLGALRTIRAARRRGIPVALERCNAHTRFAYEQVARESARIGVKLPPGSEHAFDAEVCRHEEAEFAEADALLCPSKFVVNSYLDRGYPPEKLEPFIYGVDEKRFHARPDSAPTRRDFRLLFVGVAAVRKGLHFALDAWLQSPASKTGEFWIAGPILPAYEQVIRSQLSHPSVRVLGHRDDIPELMRDADALAMPSVEEGFGLVCTEAMASGCVPLVSTACTDLCRHRVNSLVHDTGDTAALSAHITELCENRPLLQSLRLAGLQAVPAMTWDAAGKSLLAAYRSIIARHHHRPTAAVSLHAPVCGTPA